MEQNNVQIDLNKIPWYLQPFIAAGLVYSNGDIEKFIQENEKKEKEDT